MEEVLLEERKQYTNEMYSKNFTIEILTDLYKFLNSEQVEKLELFCNYDKAALLCAIEYLKIK